MDILDGVHRELRNRIRSVELELSKKFIGLMDADSFSKALEKVSVFVCANGKFSFMSGIDDEPLTREEQLFWQDKLDAICLNLADDKESAFNLFNKWFEPPAIH